MLGSLRFRLPALFLLGIVLAGLIASLISIRFFQSYTRARAVDELRSESVGIVQLYAQQAGVAEVPYRRLASALGGDRVFWVPAFPGATLLVGRLPEISKTLVNPRALDPAEATTLELTWQGTNYLVVARPLRLGNQLFGALVVAKPKSQLRSRSVTLAERLGIAFGGGVIVAGLLGLYLSRRITRSAAQPVDRRRRDRRRALRRRAAAAARVGRDLASLGAVLRHGGKARRVRAAVAQLPDVGLARAADAADGDPRSPRGGSRRRDRRSRGARRVARVIGVESERLSVSSATCSTWRSSMRIGSPCCRKRSTWSSCRRAYAAFGEEARKRDIDYRLALNATPVIVTDGDRVLQIILEPALERVPVDAGGRARRRELSSETVASPCRSQIPGRHLAEERERIFRPFWSRDGGGTGLGLAIARELAVALGGSIELDERAGAGSRFELVLPAS